MLRTTVINQKRTTKVPAVALPSWRCSPQRHGTSFPPGCEQAGDAPQCLHVPTALAPPTIPSQYFIKRLKTWWKDFVPSEVGQGNKRGEGTSRNRNTVTLPPLSPVRCSDPGKDLWGPCNPLKTFLCTFMRTQGLPRPCSHSSFYPPCYIFYEKAETACHSSGIHPKRSPGLAPSSPSNIQWAYKWGSPDTFST